MSNLAPVHRQLEICTKLLGLFFFPLSMDKTGFVDKTVGSKYVRRDGNFFSYDIWRKSEPGQTYTVEDFSQIS